MLSTYEESQLKDERNEWGTVKRTDAGPIGKSKNAREKNINSDSTWKLL